VTTEKNKTPTEQYAALLKNAKGVSNGPRVSDYTVFVMFDPFGRLEWQEATGYGKRALVETPMGRYKSIIGARLRARHWRSQQAEVTIAVEVLNRMLGAGRPKSVHTLAVAT
jgi:hypothetical protein